MPKPGTLAAEIEEHVRALCAGRDRHPGTAENRAATDYVAEVLRSYGLKVEELPFEVPEWRHGAAQVLTEDEVFSANPGPFSQGLDGEGELVAVSEVGQLEGLDARGKILLLHGEIAKSQLLPRDYPWYSMDGHAKILDALEQPQPLAVVAATGRDRSSAAGLSPFPLIYEPRFAVPSAYLTEGAGDRLLECEGQTVEVHIESEVLPSTGVQPIARLQGAKDAGRVVIGAHVDTTFDTPGALDNAAGVATLLAAARLLSAAPPSCSVEFVPFNGEDHPLSLGQIAYLGQAGDLSDVRLMVNIDDAGLTGAPTACSMYGLSEDSKATVERAMGGFDSVVEGPQWPASDHMIFAMRGVPALALITTDVDAVMGEITHTAKDTPELVDPELLAEAAHFIARVVHDL